MGLGGMTGGGGQQQNQPQHGMQPWMAQPQSHGQPIGERRGASLPPMRYSAGMSGNHPLAGLPTYQEVYQPNSAGITGKAQYGFPTNGDEYGGRGGVTIGGGAASGGGPQVNQRGQMATPQGQGGSSIFGPGYEDPYAGMGPRQMGRAMRQDMKQRMQNATHFGTHYNGGQMPMQGTAPPPGGVFGAILGGHKKRRRKGRM